ncbi:MAG: ParB/RepB/Spo0J family partition protein [Oscillospiraceae bacterium]
MTAEFNLGAMLVTPSASTENQVKQIPCDMLVPYHNHKFELYSGERLDDMVESIKTNGVLIPIIVQPLNGQYEILIGHNRWNASKLAGKQTVPAIIKEGLTDEEAEMYVIESNLMQRGFDNLKISEQAAVIAMRHSQMFSQGKRNDIIKELQMLDNPKATYSPVGNKLNTTSEKLGSEYGMSKNSIARLLRIDKLIDGLKPLVDDGTIPIRAAVNVSYLDEDIQYMLIKLARIHKLDIKKSEQLREYSRFQELNQITVVKILTGKINEKPKANTKTIKIDKGLFEKYFDKDTKSEEVSATIERALNEYFKNKG